MPLTRSKAKSIKNRKSKRNDTTNYKSHHHKENETNGKDVITPRRTLQNVPNSEHPFKPIKTSECVVKVKNMNIKKMLSDQSTSPKETNKDTSKLLPLELRKVISRKYTDAADRVKIQNPVRCVNDFEYCCSQHNQTDAPKKPNSLQQNNLRFAYEQAAHLTFIHLSLDMCHRREFTEHLFTQIVELILSLNPQKNGDEDLTFVLRETIDLFDVALNTFPPCWIALKPAYAKFLRSSINMAKLFSSVNHISEGGLFETIMELLENILKISVEQNANFETTLSEYSNESMNNSLMFPATYRDWELNQISAQTFDALPTKSEKLERLFIVFDLILRILENDLAMWILHYHQHPREWLFRKETQPLIVMLFKMENYRQTSIMTKNFMQLFATCLNGELKSDYLYTLMRYIDLLAVVINISDISHTAEGLHYPEVGVKTKLFIELFFKILKGFNTNVNNFIKAINAMKIPFLRYEFINLFLRQYLYTTTAGEISPMRIATDIYENRWLNFEPESKLSETLDLISREQYLKLELICLRDYCDWHGSKEFFHYDKQTSEKPKLTKISHQHFDLDSMSKNIKKLEKEMDRKKVTVPKERIELQILNIHINDKLYLKYRTDMKFLAILHNMLQNPKTLSQETDFNDWVTFLEDFFAT